MSYLYRFTVPSVTGGTTMSISTSCGDMGVFGEWETHTLMLIFVDISLQFKTYTKRGRIV